jgi:hypothetical protein
MVAKAVNAFQPILSFACEFQSDKAHNMFDLFYKSMQCIIELLGREAAKNVVTEYDRKVMIPLLIKVNMLLNPTGDNTTIEIADFLQILSSILQHQLRRLVTFCLSLSSQYFVMLLC